MKTTVYSFLLLSVALILQACSAPEDASHSSRLKKSAHTNGFIVAATDDTFNDQQEVAYPRNKGIDFGSLPIDKFHADRWKNPAQNPAQNPGQHPTIDLVLFWNEVMLEANARDYEFDEPDQGGPTRTSRAFAIVQLAVFDTYNAFYGLFHPYHVDVSAPIDASIDASISMAAFKTLTALWPKQKHFFEAKLAHALDHLSTRSLYKERGLYFGKGVARKILALRANDGSNDQVDYVPGEGPFDHVVDPENPDQGYLDPHWGGVQTFAIQSVNDFASPDFPDLTSDAYAEAFAEVKRLGGDGKTTPTERTPEQLEIGIFWAYDGAPGLGSPPRLYNQIAQTISVQMGNDSYENARLFALVNLALADSGIKAWFDKYDQRTWRPIVGIRNADLDGNPLTEEDKNWTPYGAPASNVNGNNFTPPFPAYPSGHATFGAAMFRMLANFYDRDDVTFSFTSDELNGFTKDKDGNVRPKATRTFHSFSQAAEENGQSRIYLGIHWSFDKTLGIDTGNYVADYVFNQLLTPRD